MADGTSPADVFALLDDEYARSLLAATSHEPTTASELSEQCDMSVSTVYRRLDALAVYGYRRNRSRPMLFLTLGIASFTVVDFVATVLTARIAGPVFLPLVGNGVELVGMVSILYAVVLARRE